MGYKIIMTNGRPEMTWDQDPTIATDLLLSAVVQQESFFFNPGFGLRALPKKNTEQNISLIRDYYKESCKWLIDVGKAKSIDVIAERDDDLAERVDVQETARQANDQIVTFGTFVDVV